MKLWEMYFGKKKKKQFKKFSQMSIFWDRNATERPGQRYLFIYFYESNKKFFGKFQNGSSDGVEYKKIEKPSY
jgi:hypothetical protein